MVWGVGALGSVGFMESLGVFEGLGSIFLERNPIHLSMGWFRVEG